MKPTRRLAQYPLAARRAASGVRALPSMTAGTGLGRLRQKIAFRSPDSRVTLSNLVQASVTVLVAVAVAAATLLSASASGAWQPSVRDEIKRSAALVEDVRALYSDEAPLALELALAETRAAELRGGDAETEREATFAIRQAAGGEGLIGGGYERAGGGYDLTRRLADLRNQHPQLVGLEPSATLARGDRRQRVALAVLAATIPLVLLYVVADLVLRRRVRNRSSDERGRQAGGASELDLIPRPWASPGPWRLAVTVALGAWLLITLLPAGQIYFDSREQRAHANAARMATEVSTMLQASGLALAFERTAQQRVLWMQAHAVAREIAGSDATDAAQAAQLEAEARDEQAVAERANRTLERMLRRPTVGSDIDAGTRRAINATPKVADALRTRQNAESDRADQAGTRANRITLAVVLAALAATLAALAAGARSQRRSLLDLAAAAVLVMSLGALATLPFL